MKKYRHQEIESKWQKQWQNQKFNQAVDFSDKPKKYILVEFPYPSGAGLHVGHVWGYTMGDVLARFYRMQGKNVLFPMGWDAFGLPAENYAIKTGIHPSVTVSQNIKAFQRQMSSLGLSFDWSREINTSNPDYYRWTQWIFIQLFKHGLAYKKKMPINWCPKCKQGLADEEVLADRIHERCGNQVEKKMLNQWLLRITAYADRLLKGLEILDWPDEIKKQQTNWIGKSQGAEVKWQLKGLDEVVTTFTTRLDTIYGATFLVLAPEHPLLDRVKLPSEVQEYLIKAKQKSELLRKETEKAKTGVDTGLKAIHPLTGEELPVWAADFVLMSYGTGAIMGVPAHDERDFDFAKKYKLPIKKVIAAHKLVEEPMDCFTLDGVLVNSDKFSGITSKQARRAIAKELSGGAKEVTTYHLRDWVFSRQHYWGEPIPMIFCAKCAKDNNAGSNWSGAGWYPAPEKDLPIELPYIEKYEPTGTGASPLAVIQDWVETTCPQCGGPARRETDTMPNWAGSSWYFLRFVDSANHKALADLKKLEYYLPVDLYIGGAEHTNLHLLYSRFWYKFLFDLGLVPTEEPYQVRINRGIILGEDNKKMSKSVGNVINPEDVIDEFGADTLRIYELFLGPINGTFPWNTQGVKGVRRFLDRVWDLYSSPDKIGELTSEEALAELHRTVERVEEDIQKLKFNTAIAALMEFTNVWKKGGVTLSANDAGIFLRLLAPFAPHISDELWQKLETYLPVPPVSPSSIHAQSWPKFKLKLKEKKSVTIVVQVNGKVRDKLQVPIGDAKNQQLIEQTAKASAKIEKYLQTKAAAKKVIFLSGKLINFVVDAD